MTMLFLWSCFPESSDSAALSHRSGILLLIWPESRAFTPTFYACVLHEENLKSERKFLYCPIPGCVLRSVLVSISSFSIYKCCWFSLCIVYQWLHSVSVHKGNGIFLKTFLKPIIYVNVGPSNSRDGSLSYFVSYFQAFWLKLNILSVLFSLISDTSSMKRLYIKTDFWSQFYSVGWVPRTVAGSPTAQPNEGLVQSSKSQNSLPILMVHGLYDWKQPYLSVNYTDKNNQISADIMTRYLENACIFLSFKLY